jgi:hypothetical protein
MAKPQALGIDPKQIIVDSLTTGPKYPYEIEEDHKRKVEQKYSSKQITYGYITDEKELQKQIDKERLKLRTIEKHLKELLSSRIVKQEKKFGRYFLTTELLKDPTFGPRLFHNEAMTRLFSRKGVVVPIIGKNGCPFCDTKFNENNWREKCLFKFANRIGAYVTYVMLQAMNPDLTPEGQTLTFQERDELANKWSSNSIFGSFMLWQFANLPELENNEIEKPFLELKKETFDEFSKAFDNLYPYADGALSTSMLGLTQKINALKNSVEYKPKQQVNNRESKKEKKAKKIKK